VFAGCRRSNEEPAPPEAAAKGAVVVAGEGVDLYHAYDETGARKHDFTRTGKPLTVPAGTCLVILNNTKRKAVVKPGEKTEVPAGVIVVVGRGKELYEVYDAAGAEKLAFKYTGRPIEVFDGPYVLKLNNSSTTVEVKLGRKTVVEAGDLMVPGDGKELYQVFDETGAVKLTFASTGKTVELFAGRYVVVLMEKKYPVIVKPGGTASVVPE
jgi:hypothetical protein